MSDQRKPRLTVRFGRTFQSSCANASNIWKRRCDAMSIFVSLYDDARPSRKSAKASPVDVKLAFDVPGNVNTPLVPLAAFSFLNSYEYRPPNFRACAPTAFVKVSLILCDPYV